MAKVVNKRTLGSSSTKKAASPKTGAITPRATITRTDRSTGNATTYSKTLTPTTKNEFSGSGTLKKTKRKI